MFIAHTCICYIECAMCLCVYDLSVRIILAQNVGLLVLQQVIFVYALRDIY